MKRNSPFSYQTLIPTPPPPLQNRHGYVQTRGICKYKNLLSMKSQSMRSPLRMNPYLCDIEAHPKQKEIFLECSQSGWGTF